MSNKSRQSAFPKAFASHFYPTAQRRQHWITFLCPRCGGSHFGRSATEFQDGPRRAGCGRKVWVKIARRYRGKQSEGQA